MLKSLFRRAQPLDIPQVLQQAVAFHQQGRLDEAERHYRAILEAQPEHFDARHLLGVIRLQQGRHEEAYTLIAAALGARPASADALSNAGLALQALARNDDAVASYDRAIAIKPDYADAYFNRGNALHVLGRHGEALASYDRALELRPDNAAALSHRATTLESLDQHEAAIASYERALALRPDYPEALNGFGNLLAAQGRFDEAILRYDQALALRPDFADALNNRGNVLHAMSRDTEAIEDYQKALDVMPSFAEAHYNLGIALHALNRGDEAIEEYELALAIRPGNCETLQDLGRALSGLGRHEEALAVFEKVISINPDLKYALGDVAAARARHCIWKERDSTTDRIVEAVWRGKLVAFPGVLLTEVDDPAVQLECATLNARERSPRVNVEWAERRHEHARIRVAYLSADLHEHPVAHLIAGLIERHDRDRFEVTGVTFGPERQGMMRERLVAGFDNFLDLRDSSDAEAAGRLRELEIDILVDLMGWSRHARPGILARRPAPVQVAYLGYPGTTGMRFIDYILADPFVIPAEQRAHYSEKIVWLPDTFQVNDTTRLPVEPAPSRAALGLPQRGFMFCSFNNSYKITPKVFAVWLRLLRQVAGSTLWLVGGDMVVEANLRREAVAGGLEPGRLVFAPRSSYAEHLARCAAADLFLDTLPFNAGTTASDALWAGLPLLTCSGKAFAGRMAGSLLTALGLPELITSTLREYEERAIALATEPGLLAAIRDKLARNRLNAPLFDTERFRRHIELAYHTMRDRHRRGEAPASFKVEACDS